MNRSAYSEIINDIEDALGDYDIEVYYNRPTGRGHNSSCGYFEVNINEDYDWDDVDEALQWVLGNHDLYIDDDSDGDFDLVADWDRLD